MVLGQGELQGREWSFIWSARACKVSQGRRSIMGQGRPCRLLTDLSESLFNIRRDQSSQGSDTLASPVLTLPLLLISVFQLILLSALGVGCSDNPISPIPPGAPEAPPLVGVIDVYPAWSPDGQTIAYYRVAESSNGPPGIYMIRPDGGEGRLLLESTAFLSDLRYSPSGSRIALTRAGDIFAVDIESGALTQITSTGGQARSPDWSPDETCIVYMSPLGAIAIIDLGTHEVRRLPVFGGDPRWSPLGNPIVFWSGDRSETLDIFSIRSDGTELRRLTHTIPPALSQYPRWVLGGSQIIYSWRPGDPTLIETRIMRADGSHQVTWSTHLFDSEAISPDSRHFVLIRGQVSDSLGVLFVQDTDDPDRSTLRQLTHYVPKSSGNVLASRRGTLSWERRSF
jgi:dipeptidyl aminopeptidase/acylaminoacyl peptidase